MQISSRQALGLTGLVLIFQHLVLFAPHYMGSATFFRDFTNIYYPLTAFWMGWIADGLFPHWAPYANMGLPFVLTMQSGIFYPPLWLFVWADSMSYTLHMANIVQALHILFGVWGSWCYARLIGLPRGPACFVAVAFQFMGCIYTNLQHPDIVRAYAWLPWLFWVTHVDPRQSALSLRHWLLPVVVCLFVTGAYQGNLIAQSFILTVFFALSWLRDIFSDRLSWVRITTLYSRVVGLALLGLLLAAVYLLPTYELMDYQTRSSGTRDFRHYWSLTYWHTLIMPSNIEGMYIWWSMISAFITVPVFCLLFFTTGSFVRREWLWVATTLLAIVLAAGRSFPFYEQLLKLFPMLGYSRLLSSDYRGLFCFGLILLSGKLLEHYLRGELDHVWKTRFKVVASLMVFIMLFGSIGEYLPEWVTTLLESSNRILQFFGWIFFLFTSISLNNITAFDGVHWLIAAGYVTLVLVALYVFRKNPRALLTALVVLELISGFTQWWQEKYKWQLARPAETIFQCVTPGKQLPSVLTLESPVGVRPACHVGSDAAPVNAYLCGEYHCRVNDVWNVTPRVQVQKLPSAYDFMILPPRAARVEISEIAHCDEAQLPSILSRPAPVQQLVFGLQDIQYQVRAKENFCFVENELFFPGWTGSIEGQAGEVNARPYCDALRAWCLPAGDYGFEAHYETPGLRTGFKVSLLALVAYGLLLGFYGWQRFRRQP